MIDVFDNTARVFPDQVFLTFVDARGMETSYTYRQARVAAAAMARRLQDSGVRRGDAVVVDLPNCPEFAFLALAAGYGSFSLVTLNQRLSEAEKYVRLLDAERENLRISYTINSERLCEIIDHVKLSFGDDEGIAAGVYGASRRGHAIMGARQDVVEDTIHFAEREAHLFDPSADALVMFTSGTTGKSKAVKLTWGNLVGSARAANHSSAGAGAGLWQAVLPFYHIGGFQVLVRAVLARVPLRVYERFDAERVLHDAEVRRATHISVVDKMLQDMLSVEEDRMAKAAGRRPCAVGGLPGRDATPVRPPAAAGGEAAGRGADAGATRLAMYRCVLLGGAALNPQTIDRALGLGVRVFASYGMTETSSQIANSLVTDEFTGGMKLLDGYSARIVDPDAAGFGRLAVRGPGVFDGYLNAHAAFTVDGFFLTGDTAALHDGCIYVKERTGDMFVSGGENVYPAEIAGVLRSVPGVADAHVFGVADAVWGRRPVAVVERREPDLCAEDVYRAVTGRLSKLNTPDDMMVVDALPRMGIGKINRAVVEELYAQRIKVERVVLHHVKIPFKKPFKSAKTTLTDRELILIEVVDAQGRVGLGECSSFKTDWFLPETLGDDAFILRRTLAPALVGRSFSHPREVADFLMALPKSTSHPMAMCALESACWDLYGRIVGKPLWRLLNEEYKRLSAEHGRGDLPANLPRTASTKGDRALVGAGAVVGLGEVRDVLEQVSALRRAGYRRVKMKVAPGSGFEAVRAVRRAHPELFITLDANQSYTERDIDELRSYDDLGIGWIEEPLAPRRADSVGRRDVTARLALLQRKIATPVCVDESFTTMEEACRIFAHSDLKCVSMKIGKFGGVEPALRFIVEAQLRGCEVWMSGMYDTGVARRVLASFETLPGVIMPGDIGEPTLYFDEDVTDPPYEVRGGYVMLNGSGRGDGLGCDLDPGALGRVRVASKVIS